MGAFDDLVPPSSAAAAPVAAAPSPQQNPFGDLIPSGAAPASPNSFGDLMPAHTDAPDWFKQQWDYLKGLPQEINNRLGQGEFGAAANILRGAGWGINKLYDLANAVMPHGEASDMENTLRAAPSAAADFLDSIREGTGPQTVPGTSIPVGNFKLDPTYRKDLAASMTQMVGDLGTTLGFGKIFTVPGAFGLASGARGQQEAIAAGRPDQADSAFMAQGAIGAIAGVNFPESEVLARFTQPGALQAIATTAAHGATVMAGQTAASNIAAQQIYDPTRDAAQGVGEAALSGGLVGGLMGAVPYAFQGGGPAVDGRTGIADVQVPTAGDLPPETAAATTSTEIPDARTAPPPVTQMVRMTDRQGLQREITYVQQPGGRWATGDDVTDLPLYDDMGTHAMERAVQQSEPPSAAPAEVTPAADTAATTADPEGSTEPRPTTTTAEQRADAEHHQDLLDEARDSQAGQGKELLQAIMDAGGLPSRNNPAGDAYRGELEQLSETVRKFPNRQERIPANQLFSASAPDVDVLARSLRDQGFDFARPHDLIDAAAERVRTGREQFGTPERASLTSGMAAARGIKGWQQTVEEEGGTVDNRTKQTEAFHREINPEWMVSADAGAHSDVARLGRAIVEYRRQTGAAAGTAPRLLPVDWPVSRLRPNEVAKAHALADVTGNKIRWFRDEGGDSGITGASVNGLAGRVFLNVDGATPFHELAGHEITHRMERDAPALYRAYEQAVLDQARDRGEFNEGLQKRGYPKSEANRELVANFTAESLRNPVRMAETLGRDPTLYERVHGYIGNLLEQFKRLLKIRTQDKPQARDAVADLTKAQSAMRTAFEQYRAGARGGADSAGGASFSLERPSQKDFEDSANDSQKQREHIATVQRMTEASPDVKSRVESWYTPITLQDVQDRANATIDRAGLEGARNAFLQSKAADADTMALGHNVAIRLDQLQRFDEAAAVRDAMAARLTSPAQALWFISTIGKTSPEGLIRTAQKIVTDQVAADPEKVRLLDEINRLKTQLSALPAGATRDAATKIVIQNLARVDKPGQRLSSTQLEGLLAKHGAGELGPEDLAAALAKHLKIPRLTPDNIIKIKQAQAAWAAATDPIVKLRRGAEMMDSVYGLVPRTFWDKVRATATISMILHGRLPIRIGASNLLQMAGQTAVDAVNSVTLDPLMSIVTGERTVTGPNLKARLSGLSAPVTAFRAGSADAAARGLGTVQSFQEGVRTMLDMATMTTRGIQDVADMGGRPLHVFSSGFGKLAEDTVTLLHNVVPYAFWCSAYKASLARQMSIAGVDVPTAEHIANARLDANKAIFQNNTAAESMMKGIRKVLDMPTAAVTGGKYGVGTATIPFAKVPGAILTEGATWTPLGFVRAGWEAFRPMFTNDGGFRQKDFVDAFTKATMGTGALVATGYWLAKLGVISGAPDENKEVDAMRKSTGFGSYRVNFSELKRRFLAGNFTSRAPNYIGENGDLTLSYNWMEPIAFPLAMGADIAHSQDKREIDLKRGKITSNAVVSAMNAGVQTLTTHPMMQGVNRFVQQMSESGLGVAAAGALANVPGNFIPSLVRQTSQYMDNTVRESRGGTMLDQQASRIETEIPWLSRRYPARYDVFGDAVQRYNYGENSLVNIFFNPAQPNKLRLNPNVNELMNLASSTGETRGLPNQVTRNITINGKQLQLDNQQLATYQRYVGQLSSAGITRLLASPQFASEPLQTRQAAMVQVLDAVHTAAKIDLFGQQNYSVGNRGQVRIASPYAFQQINLGRSAGLNLPAGAGANQ